jgi:hypothetical protein
MIAPQAVEPSGNVSVSRPRRRQGGVTDAFKPEPGTVPALVPTRASGATVGTVARNGSEQESKLPREYVSTPGASERMRFARNVVSVEGLNDIQRRIVHMVGAQLAPGAQSDLEERQQEYEAARSALELAQKGKIGRDAKLGQQEAIAALAELEEHVDATQDAFEAVQESIESERAMDLSDFVLKVVETELAPLTHKELRSRGFTDVSGTLSDDMECTSCGNRDARLFVEDVKEGDMTCTRCGSVVAQRRMVDADWTRGAWAEDGDETQQGPAMQLFHSQAWNLRTSFVAGDAAAGSQLAKLRRTMAAVEKAQERGTVRTGSRTTVAYKDKMKFHAFQAMDNAGEKLRLHRAVTEEAKAVFAAYRDARENIHRFEVIVAACLCLACARAGVKQFDASLESKIEVVVADSSKPAFLPDNDPTLDEEERARAAELIRREQAALEQRRRVETKPRLMVFDGPSRDMMTDAPLLLGHKSDTPPLGGLTPHTEDSRAPKRMRDEESLPPARRVKIPGETVEAAPSSVTSGGSIGWSDAVPRRSVSARPVSAKMQNLIARARALKKHIGTV